jgi:uncharacterized protein (TIGR03435 family)
MSQPALVRRANRVFIGVTTAAICVGAVRLVAQSPAPAAATELRFEVASVKPSAMNPSDLGKLLAAGSNAPVPFFGVRTQPGGRLQASMATLQSLILRAYGIRPYQLEGGPPWLTTDYFDISAKAENETATDAEFNAMLKSLLAERFGLRVRVETRQAPVHTLTLARSDGKLGPGLKKTSPECEKELEDRKRTKVPPRLPSGPRSFDSGPVCGLMMTRFSPSSASTLMMGGMPLTMLVSTISTEVGAPVVDQTGLTGLFDITLEYESTRRNTLPAGARPPGLDPNGTDSPPIPLPQALQQQLGLKLEKGTGPLPIITVEAAQHPSAD